MMFKRVNVNDLEGHSLVYATLSLSGYDLRSQGEGKFWAVYPFNKEKDYTIETDLGINFEVLSWDFVSKIIERERVEFEWVNKGRRLCATIYNKSGIPSFGYGKDYIDATLRCFCEYKGGEEILIPEELL